MKHCMECGTKLILKELDGEGMIPYCTHCQAFRFPVFNVAVILIVMNPQRDKILLIQQYERQNFILVAGYVNKGESAEHTAARELMEEIGLTASEIHYNQSSYFEKSNTLMLNFTVIADSECLDNMTDEVDYAEWFTIEEAKSHIKDGSLAQKFLLDFLAQ